MQIPTRDIRTTMDVIRGKWKPSIITALTAGRLGYGQLQRVIASATKKVLTDQLRELERERIISRTVIVQRILRVEYALTTYGLSLVPLLNAMQDWGQQHRSLIHGTAAASTGAVLSSGSQPPFPSTDVAARTKMLADTRVLM